MKTAVMVIAQKTFRDEEYAEPKEILTKAGIKVVTASTTLRQAEGKLGMKVVPDILVKSIDVSSIDALIFVGGGGAEQYFDDPVSHDLARKAASDGKVLAAICIAPVILARAGVLRGKKATVFPDGSEDLRKGGAVYTSAKVEVDGNIVTANGPAAATAFGETLVRMLADGGSK